LLSSRVAVDKRYKHDSGGSSRRKRRGQDTRLWVPTKQLKCRCPKIRVDQSYLLLDKDDVAEKQTDEYNDYSYNDDNAVPSASKRGFVMKKQTLLIEWKKEWRRRMKRFKKRSKKNCPQN
jgi:netrin 1